MILAIDKLQSTTVLPLAGAFCFGLVVGYITYRTLARTTAKASIADLATVIAAIGGGTITLLFGGADGNMFGLYAIGLAVGFLLYLIVLRRYLPEKSIEVLGGGDGGTRMGGGAEDGDETIGPRPG
jgi:fucose permease